MQKLMQQPPGLKNRTKGLLNYWVKLLVEKCAVDKNL